MQHTNAPSEGDQCLQAGDYESAAREMEELVSRRLPYFNRIAYRFLGNAADAEDVVQDAFLTAHRKLNQFRGDAQLSTWLTTIVCNCARMHLRRQPRYLRVSLDEPIGTENEIPLADQLAWAGPSPEDDSLRSEMNGLLAHAATQLTPVLRRTLQLRDVEGFSILETAQILGVASGTVKAQLSRARTRMRRILGQRPRRTRSSA